MKFLITLLFFLSVATVNAQLVCDVVENCSYTDILHLSNYSNAHAELPAYSNFTYKLCCYDTNNISLESSCTNNYFELLHLSDFSNAHVEKNDQSAYNKNFCISSSTVLVNCTYASDCSGYDTCVATISSSEDGSDTNLHVASCNNDPYATKICCSINSASRNIMFVLQMNISGVSSDQAFVDISDPGYYTTLNYKYGCIQDSSIHDTPAFGIVSGGSLIYINVTNTTSGYMIKMNQYEAGNKFIIPATINGCNSIKSKTPLQSVVQPFVSFIENINNIEMSLTYAAVDIVSNLYRTGNFKLSIEKNSTNDDQIIIDVI